MIIEDKIGLKINSLLGTDVKHELESIESFCERQHSLFEYDDSDSIKNR